MKNIKFPTLFICFLLAILSCSNNSKNDIPGINPDDNSDEMQKDFAKGADIGWCTEYESKGYNFYNIAGEKKECTALMKELGFNSIRIRVWVNPSEHNNWCNKEDFLVKAKRASDLDMDIMVDFHYSDWWADPSKQNIPAAWKTHTYEQMKIDVAEHTKDVLQLLKDNSITPKWVQIGNETSNGFLWDIGKADINPTQYAGLFNAGYESVKNIFSDALVIVHLDNGFDNNLYNWNLDILKNNGAKWDMIGMSLYPYWSLENKKFSYTSEDVVIDDCINNIKKVSAKYNCDVMIVETGMECADDNGKLLNSAILTEGKRQLSRIINECKNNTNGHCKGVFYWEPECKPSQYRLGAFTEEGKPTVIMDAFK